MQEAFTVVRVGAKGNCDKRAGNLKNPLALGRGSESGAYVRKVIRERGRPHCFWRPRAAGGRGGVQMNRAFTQALRGKEAKTGRWRRDETKGDLPVPLNEGRRNEAGRAMRGRRTEGPRTAVVPSDQRSARRGNRNRGTLTQARGKGCAWKKATVGCLKRTDGRKQQGYFGLIVRDILG